MQVVVTVNLDSANADVQGRKRVPSRHVVHVIVKGEIAAGLGTSKKYECPVTFYTEPTGRRNTYK